MRSLGKWAVIASVAVMMSGCVSTPARRIQQEPGMFAGFSAPVQEKVRRGEIDIGFSRDMVRLALGLPRRNQSRITEAGVTEIWIYTGMRYVSRLEPVDGRYWYRDRAGRLLRSYDSVWIDHGYQEEFPILRVEFSGGVVKAIERMQK